MAFVQRLLNASFQLLGGGTQPGGGSTPSTFAESGTNQVSLAGLRMSAKISAQGDPALGELNLSIYGMTLSLMNQLNTLGQQVNTVQPSIVTVTAGDAVTGMNQVFQGNVLNAWSDFQPAPDVPFHVYARGGYVGSLQTMPPTSFNGSTDAAQFMQQCASKMNLSFENNGVNVKLNDPYFWGSPRAQAQQCAQAGNFSWAIDNGTLAIWPKNGNRSGSQIMVSPSTGMISYPTFTNLGIFVRTLFNPQIKIGGQIQVQSSLQRANGTWTVLSIEHDLESKVPHGQWYSSLQCWNLNQAAPPAASSASSPS